MTKEEKAGWLAEHLMKYRQFAHAWDSAGPWWIDEDMMPAFPVDHNYPDSPIAEPDVPMWAPYEIIGQAEMVLNAMVAAGWNWEARGRSGRATQFSFFSNGRFGVAGVVREVDVDTTMAAAICEAAYKALTTE